MSARQLPIIRPLLLAAMIAAPGGSTADHFRATGLTDKQIKDGLKRMKAERKTFTLKFGQKSLYFATLEQRDAAAPAWAAIRAEDVERSRIRRSNDVADRYHRGLAQRGIVSSKRQPSAPGSKLVVIVAERAKPKAIVQTRTSSPDWKKASPTITAATIVTICQTPRVEHYRTNTHFQY